MGIAVYTIKRLLSSIISLVVISIVVFITIRISGNPVVAMLGGGNPTKQAIQQLTHALGLDQPLWVQYWQFVQGVLHGNLGTSYVTGEPVAYMIYTRIGATLELAIAGAAIGILISIPLGIVSALRRNSLIDFVSRVFALLGISFPNFWLGIVFILLFAVDLHWLPASGDSGPMSLVLPAFTLGLILAGIQSRLVRNSFLEILRQEYIRTARAKGLPNSMVVWKHAFRNALIPVITFTGQQFASLLGGIFFIEEVFSWPGLGTLSLGAVESRDFALVQGVVLVFAAMLILVNFLVDVSYVLVDPQIKLE